MKLVTFRRGGEPRDRVGVLDAVSASVMDLSEHFPRMLDLIDGGDAALALARRQADTGLGTLRNRLVKA